MIFVEWLHGLEVEAEGKDVPRDLDWRTARQIEDWSRSRKNGDGSSRADTRPDSSFGTEPGTGESGQTF
jgi:hypothetical protein